ncbi:MAG: hypothetical protein K6A44_07800 [bacterium]|nr:hypothetical protein [bacterium]
MYYAFIENEKINGCGQAQCLNANVYNAEITEEISRNLDRYIAVKIEKEVEIPELQTITEEYQEQAADENGAPLFDENNVPIMVTKTRETEVQTGSHIEINEIYEVVPNPNYKQEQGQKREEKFRKEFFNTSLGYVRREVTMANGRTKDFLSDLLPIISMAVNAGQSVSVLTYDEPDFSQDVEDWTQYQHQQTVTLQFLQECFERLNMDFVGL